MATKERATCDRLAWNGFHSYKCRKLAKVERGGKRYCGTHDPVRVAEKKAAKDAEFERKMEEQRRARESADAKRAEDARKLARYDEAVSLLRDYETVFGCTEDAEFAGRVRAFLAAESAAQKEEGEGA